MVAVEDKYSSTQFVLFSFHFNTCYHLLPITLILLKLLPLPRYIIPNSNLIRLLSLTWSSSLIDTL
jgi:hypothetical protein